MDQRRAQVRTQVVVNAPIERAHGVHRQFGDFKPPEHDLLGAPIAETVFDRGRRRSSTAARTAAMPVGPDARLRPAAADHVQLGHRPAWTIETDQAHTSEVEVPLFAEDPGRTRSSSSTGASTGTARGGKPSPGGVDGAEGWPLYLDRYAALLKEGR